MLITEERNNTVTQSRFLFISQNVHMILSWMMKIHLKILILIITVKMN